MSAAEENHGTYAGYLTHRRRGTEVCDLCARARNAYMKEWRARNRKAYDRGKRYSSRLGRAKTILAERHRTEFGLIMTMLEAEERKAAGLSE